MYDVLIIGGGISGSAIALELSKYKLKTAVIEKANDVAEGATKANSGIIHAGFDPKPGTLMAKLNVRGAQLVKEYSKKLDFLYEQVGAMVVAFGEEDEKTLERFVEQADANGTEPVFILDAAQAKEIEPGLAEGVTAALFAPTSAICLPWEYCLAMAETAVVNGVEMILETEVTGIDRKGEGWVVKTNKGDFETRYVVSAAGIAADKIHDMVAPHDYTMLPNRGEYYLLDKAEGGKAKHTIFQCPTGQSKGVLVSPTVHGNLIVGPNAEDVEDNDTANTAAGMAGVKNKAKCAVPNVNYFNSIRNFAGVRPKSDRGDFIIREVPEAKGFFEAAGISSPGLTAAPAVAEYLVQIMKESGVELVEKDSFVFERKHTRFNRLSPEEKAELIKKNPSYGRVICRCETVTQGEIEEAFDSPIPPRSVDAIKRRAGTGMGRCQGGFCGPKIVELLAEHYGVSMDEIVQDSPESVMLYDRKEAR